MKVLPSILVLISILNGIESQIGVKTYRPVSGNLVVNSTSFSSSGIGPNGNLYTHLSVGQPISGPLPMDPIAQFINQTRSQMSSGWCYKEVPTASLVLDKSKGIPTGNASDPNKSIIRVCCDGYERNVHNYAMCDPICKDGCSNGICVAPNECRCVPDSIKNIGGYCIPVCPIGCGNGDCQPDRSCRCKPGYALEPIQKRFCIPICTQGCQNGNCTAPDVCECNPNYENGPLGNCQPICDKCINGRCVAPGNCQCNPGFSKKDGLCEPICSKGCKNGQCIAPEQCQCRPGWTLDPTGINCIAHCERACLNGICSGSNSCSCNPGYVKDSLDSFMCVPNCPDGCLNGVCTSPNVCLCRAGFIKQGGVKGRQQCVPI